MISILVVEDDMKLNQIVCRYLSNNNYHAAGCTNPNEAYNLLYTSKYDLIISDIMMPGIDGFEFAETIRQQDKTIPILFMTSRDDISSKQRGFRIGIDDYMVKPFDMDEMVLRVGALLRRANIASEHKLTVGGLTLDEDERCAIVDGEEIPLSGREFQILYKLLSYPKRLLPAVSSSTNFGDWKTNPACGRSMCSLQSSGISFRHARILRLLPSADLGIRR